MVEVFDADEHEYRVFEPDLNADDNWLEVIATEYVSLRVECDEELTNIVLEGIDAWDLSEIEERLRELNVPGRGANVNFDIVRSDFGETLSYLLLEGQYGTYIGYKSVRDRELTDLTGRGLDVMGIELGEQLTLILGEVKVSNEAASPPQVVDTGRHCLRDQHRGHLRNPKATAAKILNSSRRIRDASLRDRFFAAALLLREQRWQALRVVVCSILIRPQQLYTEADFGSFRARPDDYVPADIRFLIFRIPEAVEETIQIWNQVVDRMRAA
jgi:hypothetical protein